MTDNFDTAIGVIAKTQESINGELQEHRKLFSELRDAIYEQRTAQTVLANSITNLSTSIDKHEQVVERVIDIENWRRAAKIDNRLDNLESWKVNIELEAAKFKGKVVVIVAVASVMISILAYIADKLLAYFIKPIGG